MSEFASAPSPFTTAMSVHSPFPVTSHDLGGLTAESLASMLVQASAVPSQHTKPPLGSLGGGSAPPLPSLSTFAAAATAVGPSSSAVTAAPRDGSTHHTEKALKKQWERLHKVPLATHCDTFLQTYWQLSSSLHSEAAQEGKGVSEPQTFRSHHQLHQDETVLHQLGMLCGCNDPEWTTQVQTQAVKFVTQELDALYTKKTTPGNPVSASASGGEELPSLLPELSLQLAHLLLRTNNNGADGATAAAAAVAPSISFSTPHFVFVVDPSDGTSSSGVGGEEGISSSSSSSRDRYFTGQVKIKNEGKKTISSVKVARRYTFLDGTLQPCDDASRLTGDDDFQCLLDKKELKKGDKATVLMSYILKPSSQAFSVTQELILLTFDDVLQLWVTLVLLNPSLPLYRVRFPCCITQPVFKSFLFSSSSSNTSSYRAPVFLQLLKHEFIRLQGYADPGIANLTLEYSHLHSHSNRMLIRDALRVMDELEDSVTIGSLLHDFWTMGTDGRKGSSSSHAGAAPPGSDASSGGFFGSLFGKKSSDKTSALLTGAASLSGKSGSASSHCVVPASLAQPDGYLPGALVPHAAASSSSMLYFPNAQTTVPVALQQSNVTASTIWAMMLLWLAELPVQVFDKSLLKTPGHDPILYLASLPPHLSGLLLWVVELSVCLVQHKDKTEVSGRGLALTFAAVLCRSPAQNTLQRYGSTSSLWSNGGLGGSGSGGDGGGTSGGGADSGLVDLLSFGLRRQQKKSQQERALQQTQHANSEVTPERAGSQSFAFANSLTASPQVLFDDDDDDDGQGNEMPRKALQKHVGEGPNAALDSPVATAPAQQHSVPLHEKDACWTFEEEVLMMKHATSFFGSLIALFEPLLAKH